MNRGIRHVDRAGPLKQGALAAEQTQQMMNDSQVALRPIQSELLAGIANVRHGFFTREGGVSSGIYAGLNAGFGSSDDAALVRENRARIASSKLASSPQRVSAAV